MPNGRPRQRNTRHANRQRQLQSVRAEPVLDEPPVVVQAEAVSAENRYSQQAVQEALEHIEREHQRDMEAHVSEIKGMEEALDEIARQAGVPEGHEHFGHFQVTIDEINELKESHKKSVSNWSMMNDHKTEKINKLEDDNRTKERVAKQFFDKYEKAKAGTLLGFQEIELEDKDKEINEKDYMIEKLLAKCEQLKKENEQILEAGQKAIFLYHIVQNCDYEKGAHVHLGGGRMIHVLSDEEAEKVRKEVETLPKEQMSEEQIKKLVTGS